MKRRDYKTPLIQENEAQCSLMVAVSIIDGTDANPDKPVLTKENDDWDIWGE